MPVAENENDLIFEANLLFAEYKNAVEAFEQLTSFYEILNDFDKALLRNIDRNLIAEYGLEGLEYSSVRTKLKQILRSIPDEMIKDLSLRKAIGYMLVKAKYKLLKKLGDDREISTKEQLQKVTDDINNDIKQIGVEYRIIVTQINNYTILNSIDGIAKEGNGLKDREAFEFKSRFGSATLHKGIYLNKPKILAELGQRSITNETTEILKVKKIDLLSNEPKWEFLQGKRRLSAKMLDTNWLEDFHNRLVTIKPEDSLMVTLKTTHTYSPNFEDQETNYDILKIIAVVSPDENISPELPL
jgi:hypothetical protein